MSRSGKPRSGKPDEIHWDIVEHRFWRWDGQLWVADGDGGRAGEVITTAARREVEARERALEEAKTIEGVVVAVPDEDDKGLTPIRGPAR
jgi:hypothetical protein